VGRRRRDLCITLWTPTEIARQAVGNPIDSLLATYSTEDWLTLQDGTPARILYEGDQYIEEASVADLYRWDFLLSAEYSVTVTDILYPVLVPWLELQTS
jgi:hypothetical protein